MNEAKLAKYCRKKELSALPLLFPILTIQALGTIKLKSANF